MDLSGFPALDAHAHPVLAEEPRTAEDFRACFTEAREPTDVPHTLFYRRSLRDLAALLECEDGEAAVLEARAALGGEDLAARCFAAAGLEGVLLDDGFLAGSTRPLKWHGRFVPVKRVLRLETLAEELVRACETVREFRDRLHAALDPPPDDVVAFKSIAAYRSGLRVLPDDTDWPWDWYAEEREAAVRVGEAYRIEEWPIVGSVLTEALAIAARHGLPVQLHTGFGDPDLDLLGSNPLDFRLWLEDPRFRHAPIVLLHASYPYCREAGWLASVYPNVYLDFGLAVPFLSVAGMRHAVRSLLELAPWSKMHYSSDASRVPDLFYLGALHGRRVLADVLEACVRDGDLNAREADEAAAAILAGNARRLYRLD